MSYTYNQDRNALGPFLIAFTVILLILFVLAIFGNKYYDDFKNAEFLKKIQIPISKTILKKKVVKVEIKN